MSNEIEITVCGYVGKHPSLVERQGGVSVLNLRIGTTPRRRDAAGVWGDGPTQWFSVVAFRELAVNAAMSLRKGDPVLVKGRLSHEQWERDGRSFDDNKITADAIGHDLTRGRTMFARTVRRAGAEAADDDLDVVLDDAEVPVGVEPGDEDAYAAALEAFVELDPVGDVVVPPAR